MSQQSDDDLLNMIVNIEENLVIAGEQSSYAERNKPLLKALLIEADARGLSR